MIIGFETVDQAPQRFVQVVRQDVQDHGLHGPGTGSNVLTKPDRRRVPPSAVDDTDRVWLLSPSTQDLKVPIAHTGRLNPEKHPLKHGGGARFRGHSATVRLAVFATWANVLNSA